MRRGARKEVCAQLSIRSSESFRLKVTFEAGTRYCEGSSKYLKDANLGSAMAASNTCSSVPRLREAT